MILDEIMTEIKRIYLWESDVVPKYMDELEKLRPYIELAEYCNKNYVIFDYGILIEGMDEFDELINKIKELK